VLGPLLYVSIFAWLCFISFDSVRFRWSPVPVWLQVVGVLILLGSFYLYFLTFRENSYLSPLVRIQDERGQMAISSGPYHYVRHPMYAATVIFVAGTPLTARRLDWHSIGVDCCAHPWVAGGVGRKGLAAGSGGICDLHGTG